MALWMDKNGALNLLLAPFGFSVSLCSTRITGDYAAPGVADPSTQITPVSPPWTTHDNGPSLFVVTLRISSPTHVGRNFAYPRAVI